MPPSHYCHHTCVCIAFLPSYLYLHCGIATIYYCPRIWFYIVLLATSHYGHHICICIVLLPPSLYCHYICLYLQTLVVHPHLKQNVEMNFVLVYKCMCSRQPKFLGDLHVHVLLHRMNPPIHLLCIHVIQWATTIAKRQTSHTNHI